jgi:hypothetical protein
VDSQYCIK